MSMFYVQHYNYSHSHGFGCICTIRSPREVAWLKERHGDNWVDANGSYFFSGPFSLSQAKAVVRREEFYRSSSILETARECV